MPSRNTTILAPKLLVLFIIMQSTHFYLWKSKIWTRQMNSSAKKCKIPMREVRSVTLSRTIHKDFKDRKALTSAESHCDLSVTGVLHHSRFFASKFGHCPTSPFLGWKIFFLIFSEKVRIAFKKDSVNFWSIILCLWLRINDPSKFCMSQLYIVYKKSS